MESPNSDQKIYEALAGIGSGLKPIRQIGRGSIGSVYVCEDGEGNRFAVKLMEISPMMDTLVLEWIIKAALATRSLAEDVNVVKVFNAGKTEHFYFIIMELINGGTLEDIVGNDNISLDEKLTLALKISEILQAIHNKGIVHKDLKPSNLLIDNNNQPYLTDFYLFPPEIAKKFSSMPHGTPYYMSPEQTSGKLVTALTDMYSFGVLLYELLTGEMPYADSPKNMVEMISAVNSGAIIPPSKRNKLIIPKLEAVILKLLAKDPKERYQNMHTVTEDIKACINNQPISFQYQTSLKDKILRWFKSSK